MTAADLAPLAVGPLIHVELADLVFTLDHLHRLRRPQSEGIDGASRPASARTAVVVAGSRRIARDDDLDGTAVALPFIRPRICAHEPLPLFTCGRIAASSGYSGSSTIVRRCKSEGVRRSGSAPRSHDDFNRLLLRSRPLRPTPARPASAALGLRLPR